MQDTQDQTLALLFILLLVIAATFALRFTGALSKVFAYQPVKLDLNPINPNFDPSTLIPKINIPTPQINVQLPSLPHP